MGEVAVMTQPWTAAGKYITAHRAAHRNISRVISTDEHEPDSFSSMNMSCRNYIITVALLALALTATSVSARASPMELSAVIEKSVCRTEVEIDEDMDRIPKTIKIIKCAADPNEKCPAPGKMEQVNCCGAAKRLDGALFECTSVQDSILVMKANTFKPYVINVFVGCSCVMHSVRTASEIHS